ncbi:MAG: hypothetical protein MI807_10295 [Verrucomicrobiales bacterium]|nr:hypothetical protein [Verrucomicrobiales bacterium]
MKHFGQILLLLVSLALLPGATTSSCAVAELFGVDSHHHTTEDGHGHSHEEPCNEDCLLDFGAANHTPNDGNFSFVASEMPACFEIVLPPVPKAAPAIRQGPPLRADRPPEVITPAFSGVFLI